MDFVNKNALILGASRGIGRAVARAFAGQGARLILPWFDWPEDSASLIKEFGTKGCRHLLVQADLRSPDAVRDLADRIESSCGSLHILINNIERGGMPVLHGSYHREVNQGQWQLEMETTLHAKWLVFQHCLPLLKKSDRAAVVNISSIAGIIGRSGPAGLLFNEGYASANRAISSLTETWAKLGAPTVRVNEIMLGLIESRHGPGTRGWELLSEEEKAQLINHTLLGRTGTPDDVVQALLYLIRDADFMTGSVMRLDGGYVLGGETVPPMPKGIL